MTPASFALYDFLNYAATAVDDAESDRPAQAETAWLDACLSASGLFAPHSAANAAVGVIIAASAPDRSDDRAALWNALNAASLAVLAAIGDHRELFGVICPDAFAAAAALSGDRRAALSVILAEIQRMAEAGDGVTA